MQGKEGVANIWQGKFELKLITGESDVANT